MHAYLEADCQREILLYPMQQLVADVKQPAQGTNDPVGQELTAAITSFQPPVSSDEALPEGHFFGAVTLNQLA